MNQYIYLVYQNQFTSRLHESINRSSSEKFRFRRDLFWSLKFSFLRTLLIVSLWGSGLCAVCQNVAGQSFGSSPVGVKDFDPETILKYAKRNSCYLPLIKESAYFSSSSGKTITFYDLFNSTLPESSEYRNRYIVGDFNVLNDENEVRGIKEMNPNLSVLEDFKHASSELFLKMEKAIESDENYNEFINYASTLDSYNFEFYKNFIDQVWKYKTPEINREYGFLGETAYASGQRLCLCEARFDTLIEVARFATSSKRLEPLITYSEDSVEQKTVIEYLPIGKRRDYYGLHYRITSKNWETERTYSTADSLHDMALGGGNTRVTRYKGITELPNFLLMSPDESNPRAMRQNGIHEVALRELSRGMLGSSNSIGCVRVSDFGSKFLRWWTPQYANFFILYQEDKYHKSLPKLEIIEDLPFKTVEEGNAFRVWLNQTKPRKAKQLEIDLEGKHDNGYILDAYNMYGEEYRTYQTQAKNS